MLPMFADIKSLEGKMKRKRFGQRVFVRVENRPRMDDLRLVLLVLVCLDSPSLGFRSGTDYPEVLYYLKSRVLGNFPG
jgi:hypothetical protein